MDYGSRVPTEYSDEMCLDLWYSLIDFCSIESCFEEDIQDLLDSYLYAAYSSGYEDGLNDGEIGDFSDSMNPDRVTKK